MTPHAAWPLCPQGIAGEPMNEAPATLHSGVRIETRYHGAGTWAARCGSLQRIGRPVADRFGRDDPVVRPAAERDDFGQSVDVGFRRFRVLGPSTQYSVVCLLCLSLRTEYSVLSPQPPDPTPSTPPAVGQEDPQPGQFAIPVGRHEPGLQLRVRQHVGRFPRRGSGSQQDELVRPGFQAVRVPGVDAVGVGLQEPCDSRR